MNNHNNLPTNHHIWVVDDDHAIRWVIERALTSAGFMCRCFDGSQLALDALADSQNQPSVLISDIKMPEIDGLTLLQRIKQQYPTLPVIIITAHSDLDSAVNAYQKGAFDYLPKPFDVDELIQLVEKAIQQHQSSPNLPQPKTINSTGIIGESSAMQDVFRAIGRLSKSSINVLINGESGTGKELIAKALHTHSPKASQPFIALNMAAIPKDLIESELFGYEKGAFTGANQMRYGRFEQANGGTLFLDEIGDMPLDIQTRLLRVLSDGQFYRVGGYSPIKVNVRILAATHQNLELLVEQGKFREDLFHRLNVIRIILPPLRDRTDDIPQLTNYFLQSTARELGVETKTLTPEVTQVLCQYSWPGNVRQLENVCRWMTVMSPTQDIFVHDLPPELIGQTLHNDEQTMQTETLHQKSAHNIAKTDWQNHLINWAQHALISGEQDILTRVNRETEQILLECVLDFTKGRKQESAKILGWGRNTLTRKLKEFNITEIKQSHNN